MNNIPPWPGTVADILRLASQASADDAHRCVIIHAAITWNVFYFPRDPADPSHLIAIRVVNHSQVIVIEPSADGRYDVGASAWVWHAMPSLPALNDLVARVKREITEDIERGALPPDVTSFGLLHNYVDANVYGGLCDDNAHVPHDMQIAMQDQVDAWLHHGRSEAKCDDTQRSTEDRPT